MIKNIITKILYFFGYKSVEYRAELSVKIFNALCTNDIEVINQYCRSKEAIDIMAHRISDVHFYRSNHYTYTYNKELFDSVSMLKSLYKNQKSINESEFLAVLFYLRRSIAFGYIDIDNDLDYSLSKLSCKYLDVYSKFLDKV